MSDQTLPETSPPPFDPFDPWIVHWVRTIEFQKAGQIWLTALTGWPFLPPSDFPSTEGLASRHEDDLAHEDPMRQDAEPKKVPPPELAVARKAQHERSGQSPGQRKVPAPQANKNRGERTGRAAPFVLDALRDRSYSVKWAAVFAMSKNKKLCTADTIPLLERIVKNKTIERREPELRSAAQKVLLQSRKEIGERSRATRKAKPAKAKSPRQRRATTSNRSRKAA